MRILTRSGQSTVVPEYTQRYIIIFNTTHMIREGLPGPVPLGSTPTLGLHYHPYFPLTTVHAMTTSTRLLETPLSVAHSLHSPPSLCRNWISRGPITHVKSVMLLPWLSHESEGALSAFKVRSAPIKRRHRRRMTVRPALIVSRGWYNKI